LMIISLLLHYPSYAYQLLSLVVGSDVIDAIGLLA
jgi:hypothetical protein